MMNVVAGGFEPQDPGFTSLANRQEAALGRVR